MQWNVVELHPNQVVERRRALLDVHTTLAILKDEIDWLWRAAVAGDERDVADPLASLSYVLVRAARQTVSIVDSPNSSSLGDHAHVIE